MNDIIEAIENKLTQEICESLPDEKKPALEILLTLESARHEQKNKLYNITDIIKEAISYIGRSQSKES